MTEISTLAEGVLDAKRELILARAQKAKIEALRAEKELAEYSAQVEYARSSNFRNRVYDFVSEIDKGSVEEALDTINRWARMSKDPVTIRFTSPGGDKQWACEAKADAASTACRRESVARARWL